MDLVMGALSWYAALPAAVMVGIFLVGLLFARLKVGQAPRSSVYVAGAIVGMSAMVSMFSGAVTPAPRTVVEATGLKLDIIGLGLGSAYSSVLFPLSFYAVLLVVCLAVNALMILTQFTDTFDVDVLTTACGRSPRPTSGSSPAASRSSSSPMSWRVAHRLRVRVWSVRLR